MGSHHRCTLKNDAPTAPLSCKSSGFTAMANVPVVALTSSRVARAPPAIGKRDIMSLKLFALALNVLLLVMFGTYFIGHGLPNNPILWSSATLWLVAPTVNLVYIRKSTQSDRQLE